MPDTIADLMAAAQDQARRRQGGPDYRRLAESFRRQTILDSGAVGLEFAKVRNVLGRLPPRPPTVRGKILHLVGRVLSPIFWRLLRATSSPDPFETAYEMALCQMDWQLRGERRVAEELAAIRARLDILEAALNDRSQLG